jgi:hypothetical protein
MPGPQLFRGAIPILLRRSFGTTAALPKRVCQFADLLFRGCVDDRLALLLQVSLVGMFLSLPGAFMSAQVVFFSVLLGASTMGMSAKVAAFVGYLLGFAHNQCQCTYCTVSVAAPAFAPGPQRKPLL